MEVVPIILQCFNRIEYTMQVLSSFKNHLLYPHEVIVIDNGSTDGTVEYLKMMKELCFIDYLILNSENKGIAEPKNQGLEIVAEITKNKTIKYVVITDNDIAVPFIRDSDAGCVLSKLVQLLDNSPHIGMCGVDLSRDNAPSYQEWWWRLRQHSMSTPTFAEIAIGFWFSIIRYEYFQDFKFIGESSYGKIDESLRNYITLQKKTKIGLLKGVSVFENGKYKETSPRLGVHLGWTEDFGKYPDYVKMKKQERAKAEQAWKEKNRKW